MFDTGCVPERFLEKVNFKETKTILKNYSACKELIVFSCFTWNAINLNDLQDYHQAFNRRLLGHNPALTFCMPDNFVHAFAVVCKMPHLMIRINKVPRC